MTDPRSQSTYQVRLGWGAKGLATLAEAQIIVIVDAIGAAPTAAGGAAPSAAPASDGRAERLAVQAAALPHEPTVLLGSLRNATATARAIYDEQLARAGRTAINLVLVGDADGGFAVEDYLAAGAIADALTVLGIDHSAPDVAVATEGFRPLTRAVKHLFAASASGLLLKAEGRGNEAKTAAELDAETEAVRFAN